MDINELEPGNSVVLEAAFISDVTYTSGTQVQVLAVSSKDGEEGTWWRFECPKTTKVIRNFFRAYGVDHNAPQQGRYPNIVGQGDRRFFVFRIPVRVEGVFESVEDIPTEEDPEINTQIRSLGQVRLGTL